MKSKIVVAIALLAFLGSACSPKSYKWMTTDKNEKILVGKITRSQLTKEDFPWFSKNYDEYNNAASQDIMYLKAFNQRVTFMVFAGTWCDDTWNLLPKFFRVIDEAQFSSNAVTLFAVDRDKKALHGETETYGVKNVPTFIVYKDGKEIGKIEVNVKKSIEVDLKEMLLANNK